MNLFLLFFGIAFGYLLRYMMTQTHQYEINRHTVVLRKPLLRDLKILHLSDTHFRGNDKSLSLFFDSLAAESYDLVVITGDLIDAAAGIESSILNFKKLKSAYGVFAVLGNHDYYDYHFWDILIHNFPGQRRPKRLQPTALVKKKLEEAGVRVLCNQTFAVEVSSQTLLIHGLDDATTGRANVRTAMQHFNPDKVNFLLSHSIDVFLDIGRNEIDLAFSGHSHGGQICLPWIGPILTHTMIGRAYASGIKKLKGSICCISRGLGAGRCLPFRLLCPQEAVILTVKGKGV